ncbi:hypothetical protein A2U01_0110572, partial [Trifolium medium]|nr:hypothetical protein [Trifolium medium]
MSWYSSQVASSGNKPSHWINTLAGSPLQNFQSNTARGRMSGKFPTVSR